MSNQPATLQIDKVFRDSPFDVNIELLEGYTISNPVTVQLRKDNEIINNAVPVTVSGQEISFTIPVDRLTYLYQGKVARLYVLFNGEYIFGDKLNITLDSSIPLVPRGEIILPGARKIKVVLGAAASDSNQAANDAKAYSLVVLATLAESRSILDQQKTLAKSAAPEYQNLGFYDPTTNQPVLTAASGAINVKPKSYSPKVGGVMGFAGTNFASGYVIKQGDEIRQGADNKWFIFSAGSAGLDKARSVEIKTDLYPEIRSVVEGSVLGTGIANPANQTITVPVGVDGYGSFLRKTTIKQDHPEWKAGDTIRVGSLIEESQNNLFDNGAVWIPVLNINSLVHGGNQGINMFWERRSPNSIFITVDYIIKADDTELKPYFMTQTGPNATGVPVVFTMKTMGVKVVNDARSISDANRLISDYDYLIRESRKQLAALQIIVPSQARNILTVKKSGGDFTSTKDAIAFIDSVGDNGPGKRYSIILFPGTYTDYDWFLPQWTDLIGVDKYSCVFDIKIPDNAPDSVIDNACVFWMKGNNIIDNISMYIQNGRYVLHKDMPININSTNYIRNCIWEHRGNDAARAWRTAHPEAGMSPNTVWQYDHCVGIGTRSNEKTYWENVTIKGKNDLMYIHNQLDFETGSVDIFDNRCKFIKTNGFGMTMSLESYGSGRKCVYDAGNVTVSPGFFYAQGSIGNWFSSNPDNQPSNTIEFEVTLPPMTAWYDTTIGAGLGIASSSQVAGSSVEVYGDAADILMGKVTSKKGGLGLGGYAYGSKSIIAWNNLMGIRLGNRVGNAISMFVKLNGGAPIEIVFNQNHTAQSNNTILGIINTALGAGGVSFEYPTAREYYPNLADREATLISSETTACIKKWNPVMKTGPASVALMTKANPSKIFAGIALDNAIPGQDIRFAKEIMMHKSNMPGLAVSDVFGLDVSVGATPGTFELSSACVIGTNYNAEYVFIKANIK